MFKNLLREPQSQRRGTLVAGKQLARLLGVGALLLGGFSARAQTPTTVFNETFEGATNSFTIVNGTQTNQWYVGTPGGNGPTTAGTRAAFISNDAGVTNAYTINATPTAASVVHMYRDVTFPAGQAVVDLGFDWKAGGESTFDYIQVFLVPTTVTPVAGTQLVNGTAGAVQLGGNINLQTAFGRTTFQLPGSVAGTTQRVVFTWRNDNSGGVQPPATIDNIGSTAASANPISGAYTINNAQPTGGTNFTSFSDAATRLNRDGVNGPLTLTVSGGPYTEQFLLNEVTGTSATNTIVVNGGGRTIQFASASSNQRAVVQLNGTDYTTINNLNIDATNGGTPGTYGYGILLTNAADNDRITNNVVNAGQTSTSTFFAGIAVNGSVAGATTSGNAANNLTLEGNTVNGGYYGITLLGASATSLSTGNVIRNNTVRDFYFYGIYVSNQDGVRVVGNDIARPLRTTVSTFYGVYFTGGATNLAVEKNRIHDPFTGNLASTSSAYGIYTVTGTTATAATPNDFVNNLVYNFNGNGLQAAFYNTGSAFSRIYNNTFSCDDQVASTATTYGIYNSGASADIKNNVVSVTRAGTGTKYGLYFLTNIPTSNYNNLYVPNGNVGYYTTAYATLAAWQAANGNVFDQNSVSVDPLFTNPAAGNFAPGNVALNNVGTPLTRVTDDITGATRGAAPDLGAYEFTPVSIDVAPVSLVSPATATACYSATEPITVQVRNAGTAALNFATNALTVTVVVTPPTGAAQTFTTTVSTGTLASGVTQNVTLPTTLNMSALGTYSFAVTATAVGDLNATNNVLTPAPTRTVVAPVGGTLAPASSNICVSGTAALSLTGALNGSLQYQSSSSATGTFTDIAGATSATYTTPVLTSTTYYRVKVSCGVNVVYSNVSTITVNNPAISAAPSPLSVCAGGTASLSATVPAGINVRYFTAATGGTLVGTGNPYVTPALTASTTYYAEAFAGGTESVGAQTNGIGAGGGANLTYALIFNVTTPTVLTGVYVYPTAAGVSNIQLLNGTTVLQTYQATFTAADLNVKTFVPLNFNLPVGTGLQLGLTSVGSTASLYRNTAGASYPYTSPSGGVSITGNTFSGFPQYYYYFYDWQLGNACVSTAARTPIQVNVTPGLVATLPAAAATICGSASYALTGAIAGTATGGTYTSSGTGTFAPNATTLNASYQPSAADIAAGTVTITLTPTGPSAACTQTARTVLTLSPPPNSSFSYPSGVYCTNSPVTVAPVLAPGASIGTFSASGVGLRIDPATGVITLANTNIDGTFTISNTVTGTGACSTGSSSTATFTVIFGIGQPTLTATPQAGGAVQLSTPALAGVTYQFARNGQPVGTPTATGTLLLNAGTQSGSYTVTAISAAGCSSIPSTAVTATVLGTQTATLNGVSLRVYPNPTPNGQLTLELSGVHAKASQLTVLNSLGQRVHTGTLPVGTAALDLAHLAAGVYTVRVQTAEGVLTQRIVRE